MVKHGQAAKPAASVQRIKRKFGHPAIAITTDALGRVPCTAGA